MFNLLTCVLCNTLWRNKYLHLISDTPDSKTMDKGMGNHQFVSSESNNEDQKDSNMYIYTESKLLIVLIFLYITKLVHKCSETEVLETHCRLYPRPYSGVLHTL